MKTTRNKMEMDRSGNLSVSLKARAAINKLIEDDWCRLFEVIGGIVYLRLYHYRYLHPSSAPIVRITNTDSKDGEYYITNPI